MKQILVTIVVAILFSLYFFPFNAVWLPTVNTKLAIAAFSPVLMIMNGAKMRNAEISLPMLRLSICGLLVSMISLISVVINNTHDYTFISYFVSMWVWLGGAYVVVETIGLVYGRATFRIVGNFMIAICVVQCFLAQIIDQFSFVAEIVDGFMVSTGFMGKAENRLYGIGCALDVAGMKFAAVLIINAYFCVFPNSKEHPKCERFLYTLTYIFISLFGTMIARTATVGVFLSMVLWIVVFFCQCQNRTDLRSALKTFLVILMILLPFLIFFYNTDSGFRENIRFAFEGFFSLAEKGEWDVKSNRMMESMIVWPDNLKTWIIGDGYFENPMKDFYYTGPIYNYYMGVDTGYCRYVFYFGILGLLAISAVFIAATIICSKNNLEYIIVFVLLLLLNFICWIKVSSDIFPVFAIFLWLTTKSDGNILLTSKNCKMLV